MSSTDCVKVAVRVRPTSASEMSRGCIQVVEKTPGLPQITVTGETTSKVQDYYTFNNVFMPEDGQKYVYENSVQPMINKLFEGYNVTILAYGQTGSGKTYTMGTVFEGHWENADTGIIPRALQDIFASVRELESESSISITCSFMELYQENLYDLLSGNPKTQSVCEIREDSSKEILITGLSEHSIGDASRAAHFLIEGGTNRSVGATAMNDASSRSHAIFTVNFKILSSDGSTMKAKFHLVDLAGSERSKKTKATGTRFKEGVKINQGLLALGNVISALGGGQGTTGGYISYRDSKLTRLLQDSLGGNSLTLMIACVSPADYNIEETLSTLRYADRAKKIKNKPVKNQNSNEIEIQRLRDVVQELRLKLHAIDGSGAGSETAVCGHICKSQKTEKDLEIKSLHQQLSNLMNVINSFNSTHLAEETFYNELILQFEKLRDLLISTCQAEFATPGTKIFDEIKELTTATTQLITDFRTQMSHDVIDEDFKFDEESLFDDEATNKKRTEYTTSQMEMVQQIKTLERNMQIKEDLLRRKNFTTPIFNDETEKTMGEYQTTILNLEKELEDVRAAINSSAVRRDTNAAKVNMDRKHKIEKLEKDLIELRKKCLNLEKTKKLAEQDRKRIEDLKKEIQEMKTYRVQLIRQQRSDSERYKKWIATRDKEINTLKEKGKKAQNEMKRMERMYEKQQTVLKRKVEEAKAINKRLQDAMDCSKKVQAMRQMSKSSAEKTDIVQSYIEHELTVLMSTIDAKIAMQSLMNDRGVFNERLLNLKSTVNKTPSIEHEIKQLEEELEMRNTQIADIRHKVMQTDLDAKMRSIPDNFNSVAELKSAMSYVLRAVIEAREDFTTTKMKAEELKATYEASEERIETINEELLSEREETKRTVAKMERDFEMKLSLLCEINNNLFKQDGEEKTEENLRAPIYISMSQQVLELRKKTYDLEFITNDLMIENDKLLKEIEELRQAKTKKRVTKTKNETFTKQTENHEVLDSDDEEFSFNDSFQDPDWVKTPMQKRSMKRTTTMMKESITNRMDGTGLLNNISETSESSSSKRSFSGVIKCSCKGSCATKQCSCKKFDKYCSDSCKCSEACLNYEDVSKESDSAEESKFGQENSTNIDSNNSPSRKHSKTDFNNITTPYYPYTAKKRKPLLQI